MFDDALGQIRARRDDIATAEALRCQACDTTIGVRRGPLGCCYPFDGEPGSAEDPNSATLCAECWIDENELWDEMWREYYGSRL